MFAYMYFSLYSLCVWLCVCVIFLLVKSEVRQSGGIYDTRVVYWSVFFCLFEWFLKIGQQSKYVRVHVDESATLLPL